MAVRIEMIKQITDKVYGHFDDYRDPVFSVGVPEAIQAPEYLTPLYPLIPLSRSSP
jgi:hypothetical protein